MSIEAQLQDIVAFRTRYPWCTLAKESRLSRCCCGKHRAGLHCGRPSVRISTELSVKPSLSLYRPCWSMACAHLCPRGLASASNSRARGYVLRGQIGWQQEAIYDMHHDCLSCQPTAVLSRTVKTGAVHWGMDEAEDTDHFAHDSLRQQERLWKASQAAAARICPVKSSWLQCRSICRLCRRTVSGKEQPRARKVFCSPPSTLVRSCLLA